MSFTLEPGPVDAGCRGWATHQPHMLAKLYLLMQATKQYFQVTASTQHAYSQPEYSHRQASNTPQLIGTISEGHFD